MQRKNKKTQDHPILDGTNTTKNRKKTNNAPKKKGMVINRVVADTPGDRLETKKKKGLVINRVVADTPGDRQETKKKKSVLINRVVADTPGDRPETKKKKGIMINRVVADTPGDRPETKKKKGIVINRVVVDTPGDRMETKKKKGGKKMEAIDDPLLAGVRQFIPKVNGYVMVIVESPGKIKKLEQILGDGYVVASSFGHLIDLHKTQFSIDIDTMTPRYFVLRGNEKFSDKTKVVKELQKLAQGASDVILASDKDREGEFIAWSYQLILGLVDPKRIQFNSITKKEIIEAIKSPKRIDMQMVYAQQTRRIVDRIVGFKISPELSRALGPVSLSAGRVQSIVCRLICDREQYIEKFFNGANSSFFKIISRMSYTNRIYNCELYGIHSEICETIDDEGDMADHDESVDPSNAQKIGKPVRITGYDMVMQIMRSLSMSVFKILDILRSKSKRYPSAPYTTSSAQQDFSTKMGFSVKRTMNALQHLYEAGFTTYLRTDSTNLSEDAMEQCKEYIVSNYNETVYNETVYTNKKQNTQEAHEAIRPVNISMRTITANGKIGSDEIRAYNLVWIRTVASQMAPAEFELVDHIISCSEEPAYVFKTRVEHATFLGFRVLYEPCDEKESVDMKELPKKGSLIEALNCMATEEYKKPPLRYSEAGLVKKMDPTNLNIGRPATYAEIINTIQKRKYVEILDIEGVEKESRTITWNNETTMKKNKKNSNSVLMEDMKKIRLGRETKKFVATDLGKEVNSVMIRCFPEIMEYTYTSDMEKQLDGVAEGRHYWIDVLKGFWNKLNPLLENLKKIKKTVRTIGRDPLSGRDLMVSIGRYGPMISMERDVEGGMIYAPIPPPYTIDTITMERAMELLEYPKLLGKYNDMNVWIRRSKYGLYVCCGKDLANLGEDVDPKQIDLNKAMDIIMMHHTAQQDRIAKYLYYHKEGEIEYIVNNGQVEGTRYLMIRDTTKKKEKPKFCSFPNDIELDDIDIDRVKTVHLNASRRCR